MNALSIVDSHLHLWNPAKLRYAWLDELPALNRAFLPADFSTASDDLANGEVRKMIFVEAGCAPDQSSAKVDWISDLANREPRLRGIVAHASLERGAAVRNDLQKLANRQLVKGVRRNLQNETDLEFCLRPEFIAGAEQLAEFDFTFDVCIRSEQLFAISELARRVPKTTFVLDHFGKPNLREKQTQPWSDDLKTLAALPNVVCKISGLTTEADWKKWRLADLEFYFARALECFGFDRLLFGGDWPVSSLAASYERWIETVRELFSFATESDLAKLFQTNAERIYRV